MGSAQHNAPAGPAPGRRRPARPRRAGGSGAPEGVGGRRRWWWRAACRLALLLAVLAGLPAGVRAADVSPADSASGRPPFHPRRLVALGAAGLGLHVVGFRYFDDAWYQGHKQDHIRWIRDWGGETYLNLDKGGHFMGGLVMAQSLQDGLVWCGVPRGASAVLASVTSWAALLEIEMKDAYYDQWGFSIPDFTANTVGAAVPMAYALLPATQALQFKASYHPSRLYLDRRARAAADRPHVDSLIDDYEGMTFGAALQVDALLPPRAAAGWPDGLGFAVGYGATGLHGANVKSRGPNRYYPDLPDAQPEVFLALDWDTRCLPGDGAVLTWLKTRLNWVHWPAPAVRVHPSVRFYLLYM
jgi:hypothetical protein